MQHKVSAVTKKSSTDCLWGCRESELYTDKYCIGCKLWYFYVQGEKVRALRQRAHIAQM